MSLETVSEASLPTGICTRCRRRVLTHVECDRDGALVRRCVHCDSAVMGLEATSAPKLAALGYEIVETLAGCCKRGDCTPRGGSSAPS